MEMSMECRICSSKKFNLWTKKNNFRLEKCLQCGLVQVTNTPSPSEIDAYYDKNWFESAYKKLQTNSWRQDYEYKKFNYRLEEIEKKLGTKGTILDIGCSFGFFMDAAHKLGWKVYGMEISDYAINYARTHFGFDGIKKSLDETDFNSKSFDVVTLWNVIEHVVDPLEIMQQVHRILKPGGMVVLTTGNVESLLARFQKGNWRMVMPPIHLTHFSPSTIKSLLSRCRLGLVEQSSALPFEFFLNRLGLIKFCTQLNFSDKMLVYAKKNG